MIDFDKDDETEMLPCRLTDDELRSKGGELAHALEEIDKIKDEKKLTVEAFKSREEDAGARASQLGKEIRSRMEERLVKIRKERDLVTYRVETIRLDTGAIVRSRAMTETEIAAVKQTQMSFGITTIGKAQTTKKKPALAEPPTEEK